MVNRQNRAAQGREKLLTARQTLTAEEPMRRWKHPISPAARPATRPEGGNGRDALLARTQVLELLQCQNQLLVDLLEAVNALTSALLAQGPH